MWEVHVLVAWGFEWYLSGTTGELIVEGRAVSGNFVDLLSTGSGLGCDRNNAPEAILRPSLQPLLGKPVKFAFSAFQNELHTD